MTMVAYIAAFLAVLCYGLFVYCRILYVRGKKAEQSATRWREFSDDQSRVCAAYHKQIKALKAKISRKCQARGEGGKWAKGRKKGGKCSR